jgi:hypothetical protein
LTCLTADSTEILLIGAQNVLEDKTEDITKTVGWDPYVFEEKDPAKSNALQSSLWEIVALQNHYMPSVSRFTKLLESDFTKILKITDFLEENYQSVCISFDSLIGELN